MPDGSFKRITDGAYDSEIYEAESYDIDTIILKNVAICGMQIYTINRGISREHHPKIIYDGSCI